MAKERLVAWKHNEDFSVLSLMQITGKTEKGELTVEKKRDYPLPVEGLSPFLAQCIMHAFKQKMGDEGAGVNTADEKIAAADRVYAFMSKGYFNNPERATKTEDPIVAAFKKLSPEKQAELLALAGIQ